MSGRAPLPIATGGPSPSDTKADHAAAILRRAILTGELAPGARLRVAELIKTYTIGATPLREGLMRLAAAGFVEALSQRGFRVAPISLADLQDIIGTRALIEVEALRSSMELGGDAWEESIVAALYRLQRIDRQIGKASRRDGNAADAVHETFHMALISACGSPRLVEMCRTLSDQTLRYRQFVRSHAPARLADDLTAQQLANAVLARDIAVASDLLRKLLTDFAAQAEAISEMDVTEPSVVVTA